MMLLIIFKKFIMVFHEAKLVIKNKNQTFFHSNKNNNRKKEGETGTSLVSASLTSFPDSLSV